MLYFGYAGFEMYKLGNGAMIKTSLEFFGSWQRLKRGLEDLSYDPGSSEQT